MKKKKSTHFFFALLFLANMKYLGYVKMNNKKRRKNPKKILFLMGTSTKYKKKDLKSKQAKKNPSW
jgi:hypothetical protein